MKTQSFLCPGISWLQETRILGHSDEESVGAAIDDWKKGGGLNNWIIDCSYVESVDQLSMLRGASLLKACAGLGLHRIALVSEVGTEMAATLMERQSGVPVRHFTERAEAVRWFRRGCP